MGYNQVQMGPVRHSAVAEWLGSGYEGWGVWENERSVTR
jgi:hypothetical protein